jgi:hypothetical protein
LSLTVDAASALGERRLMIERRARKAVDGRMTPGPIFSIQLADTKITFGISDDGGDVYVETSAEHVRLGEEELQHLMFSLGRLADDVSALQQVGDSAQPYQTNVVPGMRVALDRRLPPWAREFE